VTNWDRYKSFCKQIERGIEKNYPKEMMDTLYSKRDKCLEKVQNENTNKGE
jgi:hypothetical protein